MTDANIWNQLFSWPILNLLTVFYKLFEVARIPGAFGWAIIALTILIRILLYPLTKQQLLSAKKMQQLKPRLDELNKKHKDDKVKLQQAQMDLYKEVGINPAAGCLPLLIQMPVFISLYNVFIHVLNTDTSKVVESINTVLYHPSLHVNQLDLSFFGVNLATKPNQWQTFGVWLLAVPVITGLLQFLQTRLMTPPAASNKEKQEDQMAAVQQQMMFIMPVMIGFFSLSFPIGLALYWNAFSLFGIMQQIQINKHV